MTVRLGVGVPTDRSDASALYKEGKRVGNRKSEIGKKREERKTSPAFTWVIFIASSQE